MKIKPRVRLDKWCQFYVFNNPHIAGIPTGHPKLPDGQVMFSSEIVNYKVEDGKWVEAESQNTIFILGEYDQKLETETNEVLGYTNDNKKVN